MNNLTQGDNLLKRVFEIITEGLSRDEDLVGVRFRRIDKLSHRINYSSVYLLLKDYEVDAFLWPDDDDD